MIYRVCGGSGSGKTEYMLSVVGAAVSAGENCIVIVPEQQSIEYEREVFTRYGNKANMYCEILNFERLPNRTYREYGGLTAQYTDAGGRDMLMAEALRSSAGDLALYGKAVGDADFVKTAAAAAVAMKQNGVRADALTVAAGRVNGELSDKLRDIARISAEYDRLLSGVASDSADALAMYADKLPSMPFFKGKTVVIDSFYTYTYHEYRVIDEIARQANNVYISFLYDPSDKVGLFEETEKAYRRVSLRSEVSDVMLPRNRRAKKESIVFAGEYIWKNTAGVFPRDDGGISFVMCRSLYDECEAAAAEATRMISGGMRMRDILVVMRDPSLYAGMIDASLEKHGIKAFVSSKDELAEKPLAVFLMSAAEACASGFSLPVMSRYIKSGFSGISPRDARALLRYISIWNIRGSAWLSPEPWVMNPDGYLEVMRPEQQRELHAVNRAKKVVTEQLSALHSALTSPDLIYADAAKALYSHLIACGADKAVAAKASRCRAGGDEDQAQTLTQLWKLLIGILDQLYSVCGSRKADARGVSFMLRLACSEYKVGTIPTSADAVTVGGASMIRSDRNKAVIILGADDGVFPAPTECDGLFSDDELMRLEEHGLSLGDTSRAKRAQEKLYFYTALTAASDEAVIICNSAQPSRPSVAAVRLMALFPKAKTREFGSTLEDVAFSPAAAAENVPFLTDTLRARLASLGLDMSRKTAENPLSDPRAEIAPYGRDRLRLTPSRLDRYSYCAFSYFGRYILGLSQNKKAAFDYPEIGTFVHKILELYVSSRVKDGAFSSPSDSELKEGIAKLTDDYLAVVCRGIQDNRFKYICTRLKNTLFLLLRNVCDELASGSFVPVAFEKTVTDGMPGLVTPEGLRVAVGGTVDRVDEMKLNGKTYVRVIDYKTGSTRFLKEALQNGIGLQMFVYLFSVCGTSRSRLPAGVLYVPSSFAPSMTGYTDGDSCDLVLKRFRRSGLLLSDPEVLAGMEKDLKSIYLPVRLNSDGSFDARSSIATLEQFGKLKMSVGNYIVKLAERMSGGCMNVSPLKLGEGHSACAYCELQRMCRLSRDGKVARSRSDVRVEWED